MKTRILISTTVILFILSSCVKEHFTELHNKDSKYITITGNSMYGFSNQNSRAATISQIPADGNIMFYSEGGIKADGDILSMENGRWTGLKNDQWDTSGADADIAAYYPVIKNYEDLYSDNGELQDMVWCKTTAKVGESINLSFSHMFAKLVIKIESELNDTVKNVKVNIPSKINGINFYTGELTFEENGNADVTLAQKYNGKYEIFIPASDNTTLSLDITCNNGKTYHPSINNIEYKAGYEYICNIKLDNKGKGIYTTDDFIAFTHLINGETEYNEKTLEDFYVMQDGKRVFNLYNDLSFTEKESSNILQIGTSEKEFDYTFNGNNHTLNNIRINDDGTNNNYCGIFRNVGTNAIIKNLIINNACLNNITGKYKYGSLFIGYNKGLIDNCHINNGNMYLYNNKWYGAFNATNEGIIANCSISNIHLSYLYGYLGTFVYQNSYTIVNCLINNNIDQKANGSNSSIICVNNNARLYNIFVNGYTNGYYGICHTNKGHYDNCIIPNEYANKYIYENSQNSDLIKKVEFYKNIDEDKQTIADSLNQWIDNIGSTRLPTLTFRRWTTDQTQKVIFE